MKAVMLRGFVVPSGILPLIIVGAFIVDTHCGLLGSCRSPYSGFSIAGIMVTDAWRQTK